MRRIGLPVFGLLAVVAMKSAAAASATSYDDAFALRRDALDQIRRLIARPFEATLLEKAVKKLDDADQLLKATSSDEPELDEALLDDIGMLKAWAGTYTGQKPGDKKDAASPAAPAAESAQFKGTLTQADALYTEARKLKREGKFEDAEARYNEFVTLLGKASGSSNPDALLAVDRLVHYYANEISSYKIAETYLRRLVDEDEKRLPPADLFALRDLEDYAWLQQSLGDSKTAEALYKRVIDGRERALGKDSKTLIRSYKALANIYKSQGKWDTAEVNLRTVAIIREKNYPKDDPHLFSNMLDSADLNFARGNLLKAEELYKKALEEREAAIGAEDPRLLNNLRMLAVTYVSAGKNYDDAEKLYKRALTLAEKKNPNSTTVAQVLFNMAALYNKQNKLNDAERSIRRSLEIREKCYGKYGTDVGWACNVLGNTLRSQGKKDLAEKEYKRAVDIFEKQFGPDHQNLSGPLTNLGTIYLDQENYIQAEQHYMRALALTEKTYGEVHGDVARLCNNLAYTYGKQRKWTTAIPLHKRAVQIGEKVLGPDSLDLAGYIWNYADTLKVMNKVTEADPLYEQAKAIRAKYDKDKKGKDTKGEKKE